MLNDLAEPTRVVTFVRDGDERETCDVDQRTPLGKEDGNDGRGRRRPAAEARVGEQKRAYCTSRRTKLAALLAIEGVRHTSRWLDALMASSIALVKSCPSGIPRVSRQTG